MPGPVNATVDGWVGGLGEACAAVSVAIWCAGVGETQIQLLSFTMATLLSPDARLAYHSQRMNYGVQAFTPEGTYNFQRHGSTPNAPQTPETHKEVGVAFIKALVAFHRLGEDGMVLK